jgi:hypothetical protein
VLADVAIATLLATASLGIPILVRMDRAGGLLRILGLG